MNRSVWRGSLLMLLTFVLLVLPAQAQRVMTPDDVARLQTVGDVAVSPEGDVAAYTLRVPRDPYEENGPAWTELYLLDLATGASRPFVTGDVSVGSIDWTPDGRAVSFLDERAGDEHTALYVIPTAGGEARRVLTAHSGIMAYDWHPDGDRVAFVAYEQVDEEASPLPYEPEIYEEDLRNRGVYVASIEGDAAPRRLEMDGSVYQVAWSPDGEQLAVSVAPTPLTDDYYMRQRVRVLDAASGEIVGRIDNPGKLGMIAWSPDGEHLAMIAGETINDPSAGRLMVAPAAGGELQHVMPDYEGHVDHIAWSDAQTIHFIASKGVQSVYESVRADGSGHRTILDPAAGEPVLSDLAASSGGEQVVFVAETPAHPDEVYALADGALRRLTESNPWLEDVRLARQEVITYEARDGQDVQAMLIYPLDYEEGRRYPVIMTVHGGPESHYDNGWLTGYSLLGQMAAAQGYAVFYPNYRGSTGRGVDYAMLSQGDPAGAEFDDLVDGVDALVERGLADGERVGVTGGSYGGYATGWLSTRYSDHFAAGVMFVGISNKISKVGTTDIPDEEFYVHARKRPWDDWQFFLERSPIYYAGQSRTPLLILHGKEDPRVNVGQSFELYRHLKLRGQAPVRLVLYPGEGHGNRASTARLDYSLRALRWFETYLKGEAGEVVPPTEVSVGD